MGCILVKYSQPPCHAGFSCGPTHQQTSETCGVITGPGPSGLVAYGLKELLHLNSYRFLGSVLFFLMKSHHILASNEATT